MNFKELAKERFPVREFSPGPVAILHLRYPAEGCKPSDRHTDNRAEEKMIRYR